jgi:hypothetical protein
MAKFACFLSYVEDRSNTNTSIVIYAYKCRTQFIYTYKHRIQFLIVELLECPKGEEKEKENDRVIYIEICGE